MVVAAVIIVLAVGSLCIYTSVKDAKKRTDPDNLDNFEE